MGLRSNFRKLISIIKLPYTFAKFVIMMIAAEITMRKVDRQLQGRTTQRADRIADLRAVGKALRVSPRQFLKNLKLPTVLLRQLEEAEPFLKVARQPSVSPFSWEGDITLLFPDHTLPGGMTLEASGGRVSGTHLHVFRPAEPGATYVLSLPNGGVLRGRSKRADAETADGSISIYGIDGVFDLGIPSREKSTAFSALRLELREKVAPVVFTRYLYGGAKLKGFHQFTARGSFSDGVGQFQNSLDSFDTTLFGRRARITQIPDDDATTGTIGIVVASSPLTEFDEHVLWLVVSFVAGGRVQTLATEGFAADGARIFTTYHGSVEPSATMDPPFDLRAAHRNFDSRTWTVLTDGFSQLIKAGYPLAIALHHLHECKYLVLPDPNQEPLVLHSHAVRVMDRYCQQETNRPAAKRLSNGC